MTELQYLLLYLIGNTFVAWAWARYMPLWYGYGSYHEDWSGYGSPYYHISQPEKRSKYKVFVREKYKHDAVRDFWLIFAFGPFAYIGIAFAALYWCGVKLEETGGSEALSKKVAGFFDWFVGNGWKDD